MNVQGQIPTKGFKKHYEPIYVRKENLEVNIKDLKSQLELLEQAKTSFGVIAHKAIDFYNNWDNLDRGEKRHIVEAITNEIIFDNKTIKFKLDKLGYMVSCILSCSYKRFNV